MSNKIIINDKEIGNNNRTFIIAEVAQAHDGSLGTAHAFIDMAAEAGVDAIKYQTHIASAESTLDEKFRIDFSRQDKTRYDYWRRMEFTQEQWQGLSSHAKECGLVFLSSAFSLEAVELLNQLDMPAWKIGSGEFRSREIIDMMINTGKPVLLSTGMSNWSEIDDSVAYIRNKGNDIAVFQCTSQYPTPLENVGLNNIDEIRNRYNCVVGLSDHSGTIWPSIYAIASGVDIIEVHITMHKRAFGPDVSSSLTMSQLKTVVEARDAFSIMNSNPVNKDIIAKDMHNMRELFTKSVAPKRDLNAGEVLKADMLTLKKPGTGIPGIEINNLYGKKLLNDVPCNTLLKYSDITD